MIARLPGEVASISASRVNHIMTPLRMMPGRCGRSVSVLTRPGAISEHSRSPQQTSCPSVLKRLVDCGSGEGMTFALITPSGFYRHASEIHGLTWRHIDFERRQIPCVSGMGPQ